MFQEWRGQTLIGVLEYSAKNWPDNIAVRFDDEAITFTELLSRVQNVALALHQLGVRHGDHVSYMMSVSTRWVELFFGALSLGAKLVPLNLTWVGSEIPQGLKLTDARFLFIGAEHRGESLIEKFTDALPGLTQFEAGQCEFAVFPLQTIMISGAADTVPSFAYDFDHCVEEAKGGQWPPQEEYTVPSPDDDGLLLLTSGTTSFPSR